MTEQEWLNCNEPAQLLKRVRMVTYARKCRLFSVACCRKIMDLLVDERSKNAVEVAERYADGSASDDELRLAESAAQEASQEMFHIIGKIGSSIEWAAAYTAIPNAFHGARNMTWMASTPRVYETVVDSQTRHIPCEIVMNEEYMPSSFNRKWRAKRIDEPVATGADQKYQVALIRDIFGNPFRPVSIDPTWRSPNVTAIAQTIYNDRRFEDMPILADALEDAGCASDDILNHCRSGGEHVRGCWVVDSILGFS